MNLLLLGSSQVSSTDLKLRLLLI